MARQISVDDLLALEADQARTLLSWCVAKRVVPLMFDAARTGDLVVPSDVFGLVEEAMTASTRDQLRIDHALNATASLLNEVKLDHRLLKGCATARLDYDDTWLRHVGDIDLLFTPSDLPAAVAAFLDAGATYELPPRRWLDLEHAVTLDWHGVEVDLHCRLLPRGPGHLARRLPLATRPDRIEVEGGQLLALPAPLRLLHAACHLRLSPVRQRSYSSHSDVLRLREHRDAATSMADDVGLGSVFRRGYATAHHVAGLDDEPTRPHRTSPSDVLFDWAHADEAGLARSVIAEFVSTPPAFWVRNAAGYLAPGPAFLEATGRNRRQQFAYLVRKATQRADGQSTRLR